VRFITSLFLALVVPFVAVGDYRLPMPNTRIKFIGVHGLNSMSQHFQVKAMTNAVDRLKRRGFIVSISSVRFVKDPFPMYRKVDNLYANANEFSAWYNQLKGEGALSGVWETTHVLLPPYEYKGNLYIAGFALGCSVKNGGYSVSNAERFNSRGQKRFLHSVNAIVHELLHTFGADHINNSPNVMHENASQELEIKLSRGARRLPILHETITQVLSCLRK